MERITSETDWKDGLETPAMNVDLTIGHSNLELGAFLGLLKQYGVQVLVDIRSRPRSKYVPHFDKDNLAHQLSLAGIQYLFLGPELGGMPEEERFYDEAGYALYGTMAESDRFRAGLEKLDRAVQDGRVALMCSEENPAECHRHLLVARVLGERGMAVRHIRKDGTVQDDSSVGSAGTQQMPLFGGEGEREWKSTRSVLPRREPPSSSRL